MAKYKIVYVPGSRWTPAEFRVVHRSGQPLVARVSTRADAEAACLAAADPAVAAVMAAAMVARRF